MAAQNEASSFQAMIEADRQRKKNEDLAASIFGRKQTSSFSQKNANKKDARSPSLASRMGVQKRHSSSSTTPTQKSFTPHAPPSRPSSTTPSQQRRDSARASRLATDINNNTNVNIRDSPAVPSTSSRARPTSNGSGLKILGAAGPFTVLATNFAPGTTSADIEASFQQDFNDDSGHSCLQSCRVVSAGSGARGEFVAEIVLSEKSVAEDFVAKYNGLKADGRILGFRVVQNSGPGRIVGDTVPAADTREDTEMEVEESAEPSIEQSAYDREREAADRDRRDRERDRDTFEGRREDRGRDRDDERRRDDRERRDDRRDERERERDRERDHNYERRDSYREDHDRQPRAPVGNGYNNPPTQPGYGGYGGYGGYRGRGGGYGYGPRGNYGGQRGGYRGGWGR